MSLYLCVFEVNDKNLLTKYVFSSGAGEGRRSVGSIMLKIIKYYIQSKRK